MLHRFVSGLLLAAVFLVPSSGRAQNNLALFGGDDESSFVQLSTGEAPTEVILKAPPAGHPDRGEEFNLVLFFSSTASGSHESYSSGDVIQFTLAGCARQFSFDAPHSEVFFRDATILDVSILTSGLCAFAYNDQNVAGNSIYIELLAGDGAKFVGLAIADTILPNSSWNWGSNMTLVVDTDGDTIPDHLDPDDDNDGLDDTVETGTTGTDPLDSDSDGDGFDDGTEVEAGSDPLDPSSTPAAEVPGLGPLGTLGSLMLVSLLGIIGVEARRLRSLG